MGEDSGLGRRDERLPVVRQQFTQPGDGVRGNSRKHIPEPGERLNAAALAGEEAMKLRSTAAVLPPLPRPIAMSRLARSVAPLSISRSPSSRKRASAAHGFNE